MISLPLKKSAAAKRVVILGAGASAADGAPLQAGLFRKYAESMKLNRGGYFHEESERELATFFYLFWGIDLDNGDPKKDVFPTFEEALGLLELAEGRREFFKAFGGLSAETTRGQELRVHLISLIARVLDESLPGAPETHIELMTKLKTQNLLPQTAFISLNYDLLADNALRTVLDQEPDYAVSFRLTQADPPVGGGVSSTKLLKIHGSLNWLYCPTCNQLDCYPGVKILAEISHNPGKMTCQDCQEPRVSVVIPPTFFKVMSNFYLQQVWKTTEETLREADHLIFCGYSFPEADLHFKYLLKRAEINRAEGTKPPEVFIINEHAGKGDGQREAEKERFVRFFRSKGLVHWTTLSFGDFAADPAAYSDPKNWR